jgi:UDPglucose 6-dehydrogenase
VNVAVVGCGYVGLVTGLGLARAGHRVVGVEADPLRRELIAGGTPPFHEPGLPDLLADGLAGGRFSVSAELDAAGGVEVVLLAVQTPPDEAGAIDLAFLRAAGERLAGVLAATPSRRVVAIRSTVVPGTAEGVLAPALVGTNAVVASNPEFLREGSAVEDFLHPDRVVVGCDDDWGRGVLGRLYEPLGAPVIFTSPAAAELAKYASNALLATLISFSNEIGRISESLPGVDVEDVLGIVHRDRRLSPVVRGEAVRPGILSYLKAGCGYGGSCLPKDLAALLASRRAAGHEHPLLEAVRTVNEGQPARVVDLAERALGGLAGRRVGVLGLAFKGGTDDARSSPALRIVDELLERGADVSAYDPLVPAEAIPEHRGKIALRASLDDLLAACEACIVTTDAPEFASLSRAPGGPIVVDGRRVLDGARADLAVGRGDRVTSPHERPDQVTQAGASFPAGGGHQPG